MAIGVDRFVGRSVSYVYIKYSRSAKSETDKMCFI